MTIRVSKLGHIYGTSRICEIFESRRGEDSSTALHEIPDAAESSICKEGLYPLLVLDTNLHHMPGTIV